MGDGSVNSVFDEKHKVDVVEYPEEAVDRIQQFLYLLVLNFGLYFPFNIGQHHTKQQQSKFLELT